MFDELKAQCAGRLDFTRPELELIDTHFHQQVLRKKEFLLEGGQVCRSISFIAKGAIRQFHVKDGVERTCDLSFEAAWVVDFASFNHATPGIMNHQALEETRVCSITKADLLKLYAACPKYETFGRLMTEDVLERASLIAMSLGSDSPEERYVKLFNAQVNLFQRVPQKYIANVLGISPESLSRLRSRLHAKLKS